MIPYDWFLYLSISLFSLGIVNFLVKRDGINFMIGVELILNASLINFASGASYFNNGNGIAYALFVLVIAAIETSVIVALLLAYHRTTGSADLSMLRRLRG